MARASEIALLVPPEREACPPVPEPDRREHPEHATIRMILTHPGERHVHPPRDGTPEPFADPDTPVHGRPGTETQPVEDLDRPSRLDARRPGVHPRLHPD